MTIGVRYDWQGHKNEVVFNSVIDKNWQMAERPAGFPFDSGYLTTVRIMPDIATQTYKIFANGTHFYDFKFRVHCAADKVKYLAMLMGEVEGPDVHVAQLMVSLILCMQLATISYNLIKKCLYIYMHVLCFHRSVENFAVIGAL